MCRSICAHEGAGTCGDQGLISPYYLRQDFFLNLQFIYLAKVDNQ